MNVPVFIIGRKPFGFSQFLMILNKVTTNVCKQAFFCEYKFLLKLVNTNFLEIRINLNLSTEMVLVCLGQ